MNIEAGKSYGSGGQPAARYYEAASEPEERRWRPWLVPAIVVASVAVLVVEMYINDCPAHQPQPRGRCVARFLHRLSFQPLRQNPLLGPSASNLLKMGALEWYRTVHHHQSWRLVSSIWLHAGLIHLIANMLSLLFIGIRLEQQFGFGFGGNVVSALFLQTSVSVGASGAVFGLLGAMLSELIINWTIYSNRLAAMLTLFVIIIINLGIGIFPYVDYFVQIGGFLSGLLLGFVLLIRPQFGFMERHDMPLHSQVKSKYNIYQYVLWLIGLGLFLAGYAVGLIMLFQGKNWNSHCHWCHYLNCVPTSRWVCENDIR